MTLPPPAHFLFLALLALWVLAALGRASWRRTTGFGLLLLLFFVSLWVHQAWWQIHGGASADLLLFRRRYDPRQSAAAETGFACGRILDRRGEVLAEPLPGERWARRVPLGPAVLHAVGHRSRDFGLSGLTRVLDRRLCGIAAEPCLTLRRPAPQDVAVTLDARLQRAAYAALAGRRGAVVALDPRTGGILALVSSPSVSEDRLAEAARDTAAAPLFNRATQGLYAPGSVFKLFTAALVLDLGKPLRYVCPSRGWAPAPGTPPIRDTHPMGDRAVAILPAFAESSNIWFAKAAVDCGWEAFSILARRAGLDRGFELARDGGITLGTAAGILPDYSRTPRRLAYLGFGQGDLRLTPVHVAALTAAVANGGLLMPPHLLPGAEGAPVRLWSAETNRALSALMQASVREGTSRAAALPGIAVAGKTGTAENEGPDHAWFTCFAPAADPRIVVTVLVENGGFGAAAALPVARALLREALVR